MSAPFSSGNHAFFQPLDASDPSGGGESVRPITSASVGAAASAAEHPLSRRDSLPAQRSRPPKRTNITPVACQPCQQRKHKCDGARPVCTPCLVKKRPDCAYDAAGDQRRTASLKQRIRDLETQVEDLKDIITTIGSADDTTTAVALAQQLARTRFCATADVARSLRRDEGLYAASALTTAPHQTLRPMRHVDATASNISEASPRSAVTEEGVEFDGSGEAAPPSWLTDGIQVDPGLSQDEFTCNPAEVGKQLHWLRGSRPRCLPPLAMSDVHWHQIRASQIHVLDV
ncbi:hypothetical protein B0J12DRAFT_738964 [Macrophomina phaseolina]|uniref:Zn(2)-C6 fungal-type domain-containing protein n=1 Tax=Macrophomina phaseolina TaxID=35725 RepID=A0ABQ8GI83_9PEZI|nr:hypothetical protein B0J12DRAFT_738964 [Macrophomina phaseolina]